MRVSEDASGSNRFNAGARAQAVFKVVVRAVLAVVRAVVIRGDWGDGSSGAWQQTRMHTYLLPSERTGLMPAASASRSPKFSSLAFLSAVARAVVRAAVSTVMRAVLASAVAVAVAVAVVLGLVHAGWWLRAGVCVQAC